MTSSRVRLFHGLLQRSFLRGVAQSPFGPCAWLGVRRCAKRGRRGPMGARPPRYQGGVIGGTSVTDQLSKLRKTIRREDRRARALVNRIKRGAMVTLAALVTLTVLVLQMGMRECRGGDELCGALSLSSASMAPGLGASTSQPQRPNAAMQAALAAREAAERAAAQRAASQAAARQSAAGREVRVNPALAAAMRAQQARQGASGAATRVRQPAGGGAHFLTDGVVGR